MDYVYEYLTTSFDRARLLEVRDWAAGPAAAAADASGALLWGSWLGAPSIGWEDDQLLAVVVRPSSSPSVGADWASQVPGGVRSIESVDLRPTARPDAAGRPEPLQGGGVFAHRWFEVAAENVDEIVTLSAEAWPAFEAAFQATIHGLFRAVDPVGRLLLVTRYASVAEWERSRSTGAATTGELGDARRNFARRRELTGRQVVRIAPLNG